jgi:uncharacterized membrane protein
LSDIDGDPPKKDDGAIPSPPLYTKDDKGEFVPVILEPADPENSEEVGAMYLAYQRLHSGPLPSVETFREYGTVVHDAPERILRMAEKEQDAAHEFTRSAVRNERYLVSQGQWMGFITMLLALGGGVAMAALGHVYFATALAIMRFYFKGKHEAASEKAPSTDDAQS